MLPRLFRLLFECKHKFGFPVTNPGSHRTYQVCIRCGMEYEYDWEHMTRLSRIEQNPEAPDLLDAPKPSPKISAKPVESVSGYRKIL
jgi:hypothetical protein